MGTEFVESVSTGAKVVLAIVFATAAASKLANLRDFTDAVRAYRLIPDLAAPSRLASRLLAAIAATTVLLVSVFGVQALVALRSSAAKTPAAPIAIKKTAMEVIGGHVGD